MFLRYYGAMPFSPRLLLPLVLACAAPAKVTLPYILSDHMVLQRGLPAHIWGKADPAEAVTVGFRGETRSTRADAMGRWSLYLKPGEAGGPFELKVNTLTVQDVLVGDVWIASGQSNMEWPVAWAAGPDEVRASARYPDIRLVRAMHRVSGYPLDNLIGQMWAPCDPVTVEKFSAAGYHFGRHLHQKLGVPIGLIQSAWGGTPADAWTSPAAIAADPGLMPVFAEWARLMRNYPRDLARWQLTRAGEKPSGPGSSDMPGGLYNAMIAPLTGFPIRGVIWYQGEANTSTERAPVYARLFQTLIRDWRRAWGQGDFPFLFAQLSAFKTPPEAMWPEVREAQREALGLANTAMVVTVDLGDAASIHPLNKHDVGLRLALAARAVAYGEKIEYSGPLFRRAAPEDGAVRIWFDHAAGLRPKAGALRGFEIAGADRKFMPAEAVIEGETVVARNRAVAEPAFVRYAWADYPDGNLYNAAGLPASPFRSE